VAEEETISKVQSVVDLPTASNCDEKLQGNDSQSSDHILQLREVSFVRNVSAIFNRPSTKSVDPEKSIEGKDPAKLPVRERIRHFTWTWFTMTMATGGIANVLYELSSPNPNFTLMSIQVQCS
jgi:hypothetical protein